MSDAKGRIHLKKPTYPCNGPDCMERVQPRRRSASGEHYCPKPECQKAKARSNYRRRYGPPELREWLPTTCSNPQCKGPANSLPPRRRRAGDSPLGRWCNRHDCRAHRKVVEAEAAAVANNQAAQSLTFLEQATFGERETCPECGIDGVPGFAHPNEYAEPCFAQGRENPGPVARKVWPERFGA